jgi:hypothetical protein
MNRSASSPALSSARRITLAAAAALLGLILAAPPARAQGTLPPGVLKLHSRKTGDKAFDRFGYAVAVSDTWIVVGAPREDGPARAAYVYSATTGRFVRRLVPEQQGNLEFFGLCVAISGHLAVIADSFDEAAYVFDLRTGRQLARLKATDAEALDFFGVSVALNGDLALVGAVGEEGRRGAAYLFHARTGVQLGKLTASNRDADHEFGISAALSGSLALVGAEAAPGAAAGTGAAYVFDVSGAFQPGATFPELAILTANDGVAGDEFGRTVALDGHRALIGAPNKDGNRGAAYLYDARTSSDTPLRKFFLADAAADDLFGNSVALNGNLVGIGAPGKSKAYLYEAVSGQEISQLAPPDATGHLVNDGATGTRLAVSGNRVVLGAPVDDDLADNAGAAYLYRPVSVPLPLTAVAKVGDFAPGTVETNFTGFTAAYLNDEAEVGLAASVTGRGRGVWSEYAGPLRPALRVGEEVDPGIFVTGIGEIIPEHGDGMLIQTTRRGPGLNRTNNLFWHHYNGGSLSDMLRIGLPYDKVNGSPAVLSFPEVVQKPDTGHVLAAYTLTRSATTGTTAANDSGVTFRNEFGNVDGTVESDTRHREGSAAPTGGADTYGQFFGRVCYSREGNPYFSFPAYYLDTSPVDPLPDVIRQGLFYDRVDINEPGVTARQGQTPVLPGNPAVAFRAFLGETVGNVNATFRALITGVDITRANDEGLFLEANLRPYLRKGEPIDAVNAPGVVIASFLGYWPVQNSNKVLALVKLRGPGVTRANDCAVVLGSAEVPAIPIQMLLREGDIAGADDASRIATIQRVDVDSGNGHYHILASLTGSKARNQALFQGNAELGVDPNFKGRNLPAMVLRKGQGYQQPSGETSTIKTLTMPVATDRTGAGAKGHGQAINNQGDVVVTLEFANRSREVWKGKP